MSDIDYHWLLAAGKASRILRIRDMFGALRKTFYLLCALITLSMYLLLLLVSLPFRLIHVVLKFLKYCMRELSDKALLLFLFSMLQLILPNPTEGGNNGIKDKGDLRGRDTQSSNGRAPERRGRVHRHAQQQARRHLGRRKVQAVHPGHLVH
jgi:hypothetical protein